jgi:hypothetical protein
MPWAKNYPKILIRPSDGEEFILNDKPEGTYSNKKMMEQFPEHRNLEWPYTRLMGVGFYEKK